MAQKANAPMRRCLRKPRGIERRRRSRKKECSKCGQNVKVSNGKCWNGKSVRSGLLAGFFSEAGRAVNLEFIAETCLAGLMQEG